MWLESGWPMCRAVTVQAHQPSNRLAAITNAQPQSVSQGCITTNDAQPHSVPTVPGAQADRPDPNPSAMACAGWLAMKATEGRVVGAPLAVVEPGAAAALAEAAADAGACAPVAGRKTVGSSGSGTSNTGCGPVGCSGEFMV